MRVYGSSDLLNEQFTWTDSNSHNNGNLMGLIASGGGTPTFNRSYTYDGINRLMTMSSPADPSGCTGLSWDYDGWGNRRDQTTTGGTCGNSHLTFFQGNNRMDGYLYDAAGNLLSDGSHTYAYDAENRIKSVDNGGTTYTYDANGQRIEKITGSNQVHYFYGEDGNVLVEKNQSGTTLKEYVYAAGQRIERSGGQTYFVHTDHLGSARTVTNYTGAVTDALDYLPFGEQISGATATRQKFTGYERDGETGNDYASARYFGSGMGRFLSPDPLVGRIAAPQSLNHYAYVLNNPLNATDPTGQYCIDSNGNGISDLYFNEGDCEAGLGSWVTVDGQDNFKQSVTVTASPDRSLRGDTVDFALNLAFIIDNMANDYFSLITAGMGGPPSYMQNTPTGSGFIAQSAAVLGTVAVMLVGPEGEAGEAPAALGKVLSKASSAVGDQTIRVASREVAEQAAKEWVGSGAREIVDRNTGAPAGWISADETKVARFTSASKAEPYMNLQNKVTGSNLHVRF
jgi:RHS repeat-associated protein